MKNLSEMSKTEIFLSTPSARRATKTKRNQMVFLRFLSTPSARRATPEVSSAQLPLAISIHALREEGDEGLWDISWSTDIFLSTPSARRATGLRRTF